MVGAVEVSGEGLLEHSRGVRGTDGSEIRYDRGGYLAVLTFLGGGGGSSRWAFAKKRRS